MSNLFRRRRQERPHDPAAEAERIWREEVRYHDRKVFIDASHYIVLPIIAVFFVALLLLLYYVAPNSTIASASATSWCIFVLVITAMWPVSLMAVFFGQNLFQLLSKIKSLEKVMYVMKHVCVHIAKFVWSILLLVAWLTIFAVNPLPAYDSAGQIRSLDPRTADWITRTIACIIVYNFLQLCKNIVAEVAAFKSRNEGYYEQVRNAVRVGLVLARLTKNVSGSAFKQAKQANPSKPRSQDAKNTSTPQPAANNADLLPNWQAIFETKTELEIDWKKFDLDALAVQDSPLIVCQEQRAIQSQHDAEILGELLFQHLSRTEATPGFITIDDLHVTFPDPSAQTFVQTAWATLDDQQKKILSKREVQNRCISIYFERKNLSRTLAGLDSIIRALRTFLTGISYFLSFFIILLAFATSSVGEILLSFTTIFLAISFAFGDAAKSFFNSFVFLFVRHPFDVGDRIFIETINQPMYVHKLELLTTTFQVWDGRLLTIPNFKLHEMTITNIRRSRNQTDIYTIDIDCRTPVPKIKQLESEWKSFLRSRPELFVVTKSDMFVRSVDNMSKLRIEFYAAYNTNWQFGEHMIRRHMLILKTKEICEGLEIEYFPPVQPVEIQESKVEADDDEEEEEEDRDDDVSPPVGMEEFPNVHEYNQSEGMDGHLDDNIQAAGVVTVEELQEEEPTVKPRFDI